MTSLLTTPTNLDSLICQSIQLWIHYEIESRFDQIKYSLSSAHVKDNLGRTLIPSFSVNGSADKLIYLGVFSFSRT